MQQQIFTPELQVVWESAVFQLCSPLWVGCGQLYALLILNCGSARLAFSFQDLDQGSRHSQDSTVLQVESRSKRAGGKFAAPLESLLRYGRLHLSPSTSQVPRPSPKSMRWGIVLSAGQDCKDGKGMNNSAQIM